MWSDPLLNRFVSFRGVHRFEVDYCMYKTLYKKPISFITNLVQLTKLSRKCCHSSHNIILEGRVRCCAPTLADDKVGPSSDRVQWHWKTSLASPYPVQLMRHAAEALAEIAPQFSDITRAESSPSQEAFDEVARAFAAGCRRADRGGCELERANHRWPPIAPSIAPLPKTQPRPWPSGSPTWGRCSEGE